MLKLGRIDDDLLLLWLCADLHGSWLQLLVLGDGHDCSYICHIYHLWQMCHRLHLTLSRYVLLLILYSLLEHFVVQYFLLVQLLYLLLMAYVFAKLLATMELVATVLAFELFEIHVSSFVIQAISIGYKSFWTKSALKGLFTSVSPLMIDPTCLVLEDLFAVLLWANK